MPSDLWITNLYCKSLLLLELSNSTVPLYILLPSDFNKFKFSDQDKGGIEPLTATMSFKVMDGDTKLISTENVTTGEDRFIEKISLSANTSALTASLTLILQFDEGVLGTIQLKIPLLAGILEIIFIQLFPEFVVYSILTLAISILVQVISYELPTVQISPPLGEVTSSGGIVALIVNGLSLISDVCSFRTSDILTRHCVAGVFGINQE